MQFYKALLPGVLSLSVMGCLSNTDEDNVACTAVFTPGLSVEVVDAESGEGISCSATVVFQDGNYEEGATNEAGPNCDNSAKFYGAYERAGTYDIIVVKPGYLENSVTDVVVTEDVCHVKTVNVTIELTAL